MLNTVTAEIKAAPPKIVIPKKKALLCLFSFGITNFWGAAFISDFTVFQKLSYQKKSLLAVKGKIRNA